MSETATTHAAAGDIHAVAAEIAASENLPPESVGRVAAILRRHGFDPGRWLSVSELSSIFRVGREAILRKCRSGEFPSARNFGTPNRQDWRVQAGDIGARRDTPPAAPRRPRRSCYRPQILTSRET
jgi:hypothetical protein